MEKHVDTSRGRDEAIERLLKRSFTAPDAVESGLCLDAETAATWVEGSLTGAALEAAQAHAAGCARCQALVGALSRLNTAVPPLDEVRAPRRWLTWLVPLTAAATAVALWVAL